MKKKKSIGNIIKNKRGKIIMEKRLEQEQCKTCDIINADCEGCKAFNKNIKNLDLETKEQKIKKGDIKMEKVMNGVITKVFLGCDDSMGYILQISYIFEGFGGVYTISLSDTKKIIELFEMLEINDFDKIKGQYIRVKTIALKQYSIGNIVKNKWIIF